MCSDLSTNPEPRPAPEPKTGRRLLLAAGRPRAGRLPPLAAFQLGVWLAPRQGHRPATSREFGVSSAPAAGPAPMLVRRLVHRGWAPDAGGQPASPRSLRPPARRVAITAAASRRDR